jgi:FtsZ-binding cell division protein ZapB
MANEADAAKDRLIKQLETENEQLKTENEQFKTENEQLKTENEQFKTENEQLNEQLKGRIELLGLDEQIDSETQFDSIIVGKMDRSSDDIQF